MEKKTEKLILRMTASFVSSIGYGNVYRCQVAEIISGKLDEKNINVTVLAGDKANLAFMSTHLDTVEFEMGCRKKNTNEPYSLMPISGFVDKNRTSWEIEYLKDIQT